jgi:hypothetical protein
MANKLGRDYPLSQTPKPSPIFQGPNGPIAKSGSAAVKPVGTTKAKEPNSVAIIKAGADVVRAAREERAANINAKANKVEAVATRKEASADKIAARKQGRAEIIRAKADLARAKKGY